MLVKALYAVVVWVVVAILLYLFGGLLMAVTEPTTHAIGAFLREHAGLIGFLCGLAYFFFGTRQPGLRR